MIVKLGLLAAEGGLGKDFFAILVAALAGIGVLFYAAASDLFELKVFKFDPYSFRLPKEVRVEYWYTRAARRVWSWLSIKPPKETRVDYWYTRSARRFEAFLASGGWSYAKAKKQAKVRTKGNWRRMRKETRRMLPEAVKRLNRDVALGALAIAIVLVVLLVVSLV
ncbi:MAG: hypothetical protein JW854_06460 [Actinobacteria bacterium]|nr:hypothetical protein [Actinomycetota bacterium]